VRMYGHHSWESKMKMLATGLLMLAFASGVVQAEGKSKASPLARATNAHRSAELERLSRTWMDAMLRHDKTGLEALMAPEYVLYSPDPKHAETPRAIWLDTLFNHLTIKSWEQSDISAHIYGSIAVVTSTYSWAGTIHDKEFDSKGHCTDVWRSSAKRWQVVSRTCMPFPGSLTLGGGVAK